MNTTLTSTRRLETEVESAPPTADPRSGAGDAATVPLIDRVIARSPSRPDGAAEVHALVQATFEVIAATGCFDPHVRDILARCELSRQVLYRHFDSKDELLVVVFDEGARIVAGYLCSRIARADGPADALRAWIGGVMRQAQDDRTRRLTRPFAYTGHRLAVGFPAQYAEARRHLSDPLNDLVAAGVDTGAFTTDRPTRDVEAIYDLVFARQHRHLVLDRPPGDEEIDDLHQFALRALGHRPARRP